MKLRTSFQENLKAHYSSRKYREQINLMCTERCLKTFRDDDLTRTEINCLIACYNKSYRYLAFSNALYTYMIGGKEVDDFVSGQYELEN